jgi:exopolyphosphatase/guanosine-5'-triphosphate,3'-diphosphate pyrophosphatase
MLAAVDLGSNSFRLHIARHEGDAIRVVKSAREPIRLAAGLDADGNLTPQAIQNAVDCLARFREILNAYPIDSVRVVATNTIRIAKNSAAILPRAEAAIGHPIDVISGEEEGRLIYMGVSNAIPVPDERRSGDGYRRWLDGSDTRAWARDHQGGIVQHRHRQA